MLRRFAEVAFRQAVDGDVVVARREVPPVRYSRAVGVMLYIKGGMTQDWMMTPALGNRVRLLRIKAWATPRWDVVGAGASVWFRFGGARPETWAGFGLYESIIPIYSRLTGLFPVDFYRELWEFDQSMDRLFIGDQIRFGAGVEVTGVVTLLQVYVLFEVSEV